jgi:exodeoxyribonuclease VII large subunit
MATASKVIERNYAIVRDARGAVVRSPGNVGPGERLDIEVAEGGIGVRVESGTPDTAA